MRKVTIASLFLVLTLVLAACSNAGGNNSGMGTQAIEGTDTTGLDATSGVPVTGETVAPDGTMATATVGMGDTLETVTPEGGALTTATLDSAGTLTTATVDGADANELGLQDAYPNLFSELNDYIIVDETCNQVADIDGFVVSQGDGQILYVVATAAGDLDVDGRLLIPYGALQVKMDAAVMGEGTSTGSDGTVVATVTPEAGGDMAVTGTPADGETRQGVGENAVCDVYDANQAFMLNGVTVDDLAGAPNLGDDDDLNTLFSVNDWDNDIRSFWTGLGVTVDQAVGGSSTDAVTSTPAAGDAATTGTPAADGAAMGALPSTFFVESVGDFNVRNLADENLGDVADMIVDPTEGRFTHAILSVGGFLGIGDRYVPIPWEAINWQADEDGEAVLVIDADQSRLETAPGFDSLTDFPNTDEAGWDEEFTSFWQTNGS